SLLEGQNIRKTSGASRREIEMSWIEMSCLNSSLTICRRRSRSETLRIEFGVPIEIVEPAIVQIIRREQAAVAVQLMHSRRERRLPRKHLRLLRRQVAFSQIAWRAGGDDVFPGGLAAFAARDDVVEGEIVVRRTILADEPVAQEHVEPGESRVGARSDEGLQRHHAWQLNLERGAAT